MVIWRNKSTTAGSLFDTTLTVRHFKLYSYFTAFLAIVTGGAIYILFRPVEPLFFTWVDDVGAGNMLSNIRRFTLPLKGYIPEWALFSLPNGLWAFAYALIIAAIWSGSKSGLRYFWFATIPVLVLGYELLQLTGILPGTFCLLDLVFGLAGIIFGIQIGLKIFNRRI
jgi:hypothetical protein